MYGGTPGRNMANLTDANVPVPGPDGKDARWTADLGSKSYGGPVVAGGLVFVGTNNQRPRNDRDTARDKNGQVEPVDRGVLMCFDARTGAFLWQAVHDKLEGGRANDWPEEGIGSSPAVEGGRVYYVSNRAEVVCADAKGFADGNQGFQGEKYREDTDADVLWSFDLVGELKVFPHNLACCSPLVVGDLVFVVTANGVDDTHEKLPSPDAPSFVALDKRTGKLVWKDNSPGKNVMHGQWGIPSYAADPVPQVIFPGGDGWLRAFDPPTGRLLWKFDCNRKDAVYELGGTGTRNDFVNNAPVVHGRRVYVGTGQDPEHSTGVAHFWCLDLDRAVRFGAKNKNADVSPVNDNFDPKAAVNASSALAWVYGGDENRKWAWRDFKFGRTMSTACVVDGVLYAPELAGQVHCLSAATGEHYWAYDTKASIWNAAYYADGKVFVGTDAGELFVFRHDRKPLAFDGLAAAQGAANQREARALWRGVQKQVADKYLLAKVELDAPIRSAPAVAGGVLYVATEKTLYAFGPKP
jgi:outer membrane protein assembly factor BamB